MNGVPEGNYNSPLWRRPVLYLVRHCSTDLNSEDIYRGWADPPLNENGHEEAERLGNFFSFESLGPIVSADFVRCMETAEYILPYSSYTHFIDPNANLRTLNIGKFSGQPKNAANERDMQQYVKNPDLAIPDGESLHNFTARWEETLNSYLAYAREDYPTVLVCEGCNIGATAYVCLDEGNRPDFFDPYENTVVEPGGAVAVYLSEQGKMSIEPRFGTVEKMELTQE